MLHCTEWSQWHEVGSTQFFEGLESVAVHYEYHHDDYYFCQEEDPERGILDGAVNKDTEICEIIFGDEIIQTQHFKVLKLSPDETESHFEHETEDHPIPKGAVPCQDKDVPKGKCFLGQSVYTEGICWEGLGKINTEEHLIHMTFNGTETVCPFFMFLVTSK